MKRIFEIIISGIIIYACSSAPPQHEAVITEEDDSGYSDDGTNNEKIENTAVSIADSVFIESNFVRYHEKFPAVDKNVYIQTVTGKTTNFCLFQDNPARECADFGDYENDHQRKKTAEEAYKAALLSEGYNTARLNIRLYGAMSQLCVEGGDLFNAQVYLNKLVSLDSDNAWAKKKLKEILQSKYE